MAKTGLWPWGLSHRAGMAGRASHDLYPRWSRAPHAAYVRQAGATHCLSPCAGGIARFAPPAPRVGWRRPGVCRGLHRGTAPASGDRPWHCTSCTRDLAGQYMPAYVRQAGALHASHARPVSQSLKRLSIPNAGTRAPNRPGQRTVLFFMGDDRGGFGVRGTVPASGGNPSGLPLAGQRQGAGSVSMGLCPIPQSAARTHPGQDFTILDGGAVIGGLDGMGQAGKMRGRRAGCRWALGLVGGLAQEIPTHIAE